MLCFFFITFFNYSLNFLIFFINFFVNFLDLVGNEEEKVSEVSVESAFSAFLIKSNYSSPTSSPFVIKPKKIESDEGVKNI